MTSVERLMAKDQDSDGEVSARELLPDFDFFDPAHALRADDVLLDRVTRIRLAPGSSLNRRPGISKVLRELRIEFDQR